MWEKKYVPYILNTYNIGKKDVICGRDKFSFTHCGNNRFRVIIDIHRTRYKKTPSKEGKSAIIIDIIRLIEYSGGRFLKRREEDPDSWYLAGMHCSREKVSHALRCQKRRKRILLPQPKKEIVAKTSAMTETQDRQFQDVLKYQQMLFNQLLDT